MDLIIKVAGEITSSNFNEYKENILRQIDEINLDLSTDEDFFNAKQTIKDLKKAEDAIDQARDKALSETADVSDLFDAMTEILGRVKEVCSDLTKQVKTESVKRKHEAMDNAVSMVTNQINTIVGNLPYLDGVFTCVRDDFNQVVKNKKSLDTIKIVLEAESNRLITDIVANVEQYRINYQAITAIRPSALFPDTQALILKTTDEVEAIIKARVAEHNLEQERLDREEKEKKEAEAQEQQEKEAPLPQQKPVTTTFGALPAHVPVTRKPLTVPSTQLPSKKPDDDLDKFVMTVAILATVDRAKEIARDVNSVVSKYKEVTAINLGHVE